MLSLLPKAANKATRLNKIQVQSLIAIVLICLVALTLSWNFFYKQGGTISFASHSEHSTIIYLAAAHRSGELIQSLTLVARNLHTGSRRWPIILFHTGDFDSTEARSELLTRLGSPFPFIRRIRFSKLFWTLPEGISNNITIVDPVFAGVWPGYHHMCAFFSAPIFSHPALEGYTYYLRLDTDSFIEAPLCYDPFEVMHARNRTYGYRYLGMDPPEVTRGLWSFMSGRERLRMNGWKWPNGRDEATMPGEMGENDEGEWPEAQHDFFPGYYNNFEIVKLEAFRRPDVQEWLTEVMRDPKRAYKYRWANAVP
ncbi:glycosyltransferase family 15 protein [Hydnum rufescens UP504]|uniref:Glycosyltransferase family 15 protein n=1 Tax=Hydnum rufescens UP504 TaxID=1448309 RepID=A0A9P6AY71_9AGAM|nr:glycosyltransferase family 15 protein [Hydnum rufescens UP504]